MKNQDIVLFVCLTLLQACNSSEKPKEETKQVTKDSTTAMAVYKPDSQELHDEIARQDSIYFNAYNNCNMDLQKAYYSDTLEFYHDKGGFTNSKSDVLNGIKNNICGKVTRELVKGSIEVYPIKDWGAIEMGMHMFHNSQEPNAVPHPSKFILFWQKVNKGWKIKRVVSLH
jgi:hypothetical protein